MNELTKIDKQIEKEVFLKDYAGPDRMIYAEEKRKQLEEEKQNTPAFQADVDGIPTLNWCVDGFRKQQLVIVSGPPKNGKSELCATFTTSFMKQGKRCAWFPFEGMYEELFARFPDALDFHIPNQMDRGRLEWVEDRIIESKQKYGTEIVFIDNLDFLCDPKIMTEIKGIAANYSTYVGSIVQTVKELAVRHNILIFLMSHIAKSKWTNNKLPTAEDLRDTGKTAQLADIVLMIIRRRADGSSNEVYTGNDAIMGVMENRLNGRTKKINLVLEDKKFKEVQYHETRNENNQDWITGN